MATTKTTPPDVSAEAYAELSAAYQAKCAELEEVRAELVSAGNKAAPVPSTGLEYPALAPMHPDEFGTPKPGTGLAGVRHEPHFVYTEEIPFYGDSGYSTAMFGRARSVIDRTFTRANLGGMSAIPGTDQHQYEKLPLFSDRNKLRVTIEVVPG